VSRSGWRSVGCALALGALALGATSCASTTGGAEARGASEVKKPDVGQLGTGAAVPADAASPGSTGGDMSALNQKLLQRGRSAQPAGDLPLGAGDLIEVSVVDLPELSARKVRVPREGGVKLPLVGELPVAGHTASAVEEDLRQRLQKTYMHDPQVTVFVHERRSQRISVLGAVRKGGLLELSGRVRLADALAMAEGLSDDADHVVYLFRRVPADIAAQAAQASPETPGLAKTVPATALAKPDAGGAPGGAAGRTQGGPPAMADVMTTIDLEKIANGNEEFNVPLEAGDVIQVPRAGAVYVGGQVTKPGSFVLKGKTTVHQAILAAGGPTNVAALADVRLYHTKPDGQITVDAFDLDKFEEGQASPEVKKNDVVVVGKHMGKAIFYGTLDFVRGVLGMSVGF
jgi:polysaccharide export outer membrane protein